MRCSNLSTLRKKGCWWTHVIFTTLGYFIGETGRSCAVGSGLPWDSPLNTSPNYQHLVGMSGYRIQPNIMEDFLPSTLVRKANLLDGAQSALNKSASSTLLCVVCEGHITSHISPLLLWNLHCVALICILAYLAWWTWSHVFVSPGPLVMQGIARQARFVCWNTSVHTACSLRSYKNTEYCKHQLNSERLLDTNCKYLIVPSASGAAVAEFLRRYTLM